MESKDGTDYAQNYDLIVKLMGEALKGETLEVIGVQSGRIEDAFGFEPPAADSLPQIHGRLSRSYLNNT